MTHIEQLIQDLCPQGVEWKTIGETLGVNRGRRLTKSELSEDGSYEVYHGSKDTPLGCYTESNAPKDTVIIVNTGGIGGVKYLDKDFWCSDGSFWLGHSDLINNKFAYYFLSRYEDYFESQKRVGGVPTIDRKVVENFEIPIPPLEIQKKIVECLDKFSALAAELQAELQMRRKQYEYYRTHLLTPHSESNSADNTDDAANWEWKTLGEVATLSRGKVYSKEYLRDNAGEYPVYSSQTANNGELGRINTYDYDGKYLTWTTDGAYAGTVFRREGKFSITNVCGLISNIDEFLSIDFLFYWLNKVAKSYVYQGMGNPKLMSNIMATIKIPIPPLAEQERIVSILDKFEALTTSLSDGIPAEQAAQQKRYEYYRDLLLTFPRKEV